MRTILRAATPWRKSSSFFLWRFFWNDNFFVNLIFHLTFISFFFVVFDDFFKLETVCIHKDQEFELKSAKNDGVGDFIFAIVSAPKNDFVGKNGVITNFFLVPILIHCLHNEDEIVIHLWFEISDEK